MLNRISAENLKRSAGPPVISATVIAAKVSWNMQYTKSGRDCPLLKVAATGVAGAAAGAAGAVAAGVASAPGAGGLSCANAEVATATKAAIDPSSANRASKFFMSFLP